MGLKELFFFLLTFLYVERLVCYVRLFHSPSEKRKVCYELIFKKQNYINTFDTYFLKKKRLSHFELNLIFRKQKDQSMIRSIPSHVRRKKKKKKKKKKELYLKNDEKKKVNKKLMRRRLLKYYKLKKKNEGTEENIFNDKKKLSIFDYIENKMSGSQQNMNYKTTSSDSTNTTSNNNSNTFSDNKIDNILIVKKQSVSTNNVIEKKNKLKDDQYTSNNLTHEGGGNNYNKNTSHMYSDDFSTTNQNYKQEMSRQDEQTKIEQEESRDKQVDDDITTVLPTVKKKKKLKKLKKNMHIGKHHRKVYTYKKKIAVDDIHDYISNKQLSDGYILKKDTLKNVYINKPLFNFYNFYNFFQIDHIEKYNKAKILNLIYYYIYKYKNNVNNEIKYDYVKTDNVVKTYEHIADDQQKMNFYLQYYINMNNNKYLYMNIDKNYTLKKKITDAFTISNLNKVDSLHIHNYKIIWTIRNVKEKLFWRFREMGNIPLTTSAFSFAGKKLFKLKIWLDGHKSAKKDYVSIGLKQLQNYGLLEEYICFSLNGITRGPFTYLSKEYYQNAYNFCKFDDLNLEKDELQLSLFVYDSVV
ncbi:conserved protein, unknown function [Hepatocystis sp. ex Piliocolobus tephrosceles]|nr:conserved protein, unknown function [Hepatocystis sp. ex Piliocolobus tephrosceles]